MNMKLKKILDDIQKTEDKIAELQEHLKRQNTLKQQMEDVEIIKSFRSMKLDSRELLVLLDGIQKGTVTIQMNEDGRGPMALEEITTYKWFVQGDGQVLPK